MREKKIRGMKRKTKTLINRIADATKAFPSTFYNGAYWHMPLPGTQAFIDSIKTPRKVKRLCIQTLLDRADLLMKMKPNDTNTYRVVVMITIASLWHSQIIIFKNNDYFHSVFNRDNEFQKWIPLSNEFDFGHEWGISISNSIQTLHFQEIIKDEDEFYDEVELLFIGELS
ncbi:group-specific protein [Bacillus proteolyticus]|uniref:Group-specific protein n=1 Tax=Bacillus proteolyticus TaxID=2026192 RepID=A0AA44KRL1_9BACI|nr:DUF3916 domain-containing protein [Bacillus proteolyticus]OJE37679.1 group-specific protein [Bacillus proteolyticus]PGV65245.1 DUF3916 domain-containing protein [Bacillus cereus]